MHKCKIDDCAKPAVSIRGQYSFLCAEHKIAAGFGNKRNKNGKDATWVPSLEEASKRLVDISARIDISAKEHTASRNVLITDVNQFNAVIEDMRKILKLITSPNAH
jgi:hypothetical protein